VRLPERLRDNLRKPLGILLLDSEVTKENLLKKISKDAFLITVGDASTEKMIKFGMNPLLQIVDALEKRAKRSLPEGKVATLLHCINPPAEITDYSVDTIKKAFSMEKPVRIIVDGEEDLLVIPAALFAPENAIILYGQPNKGLVIVKVNQEIRNKAKMIMESMS
jgi:GTP-dependent dephospho-CoA kinase